MVKTKFGKFMTLRDMQNLMARVMKKGTSGHKDVENTLVFLSNDLSESPDDRGRVAVDENDVLAVVYYQVTIVALISTCLASLTLYFLRSRPSHNIFSHYAHT